MGGLPFRPFHRPDRDGTVPRFAYWRFRGVGPGVPVRLHVCLEHLRQVLRRARPASVPTTRFSYPSRNVFVPEVGGGQVLRCDQDGVGGNQPGPRTEPATQPDIPPTPGYGEETCTS